MDIDVDFSDDEPSRPLVSMPPRCKDWQYFFECWVELLAVFNQSIQSFKFG